MPKLDISHLVSSGLLMGTFITSLHIGYDLRIESEVVFNGALPYLFGMGESSHENSRLQNSLTMLTAGAIYLTAQTAARVVPYAISDIVDFLT